MDRKEPERLLTAEEIGEHLGYTARTVYGLVQKRTIPHIRIGRSVRFRLSDVTRWVDDRVEREKIAV